MQIVDAFAGIGGFHLGIRGKCAAIIENSPAARETYTRNFQDYGVVLEDIRNSVENIPPNFDLLCGGFPCQPFSRNGQYYNKTEKAINNISESRDYLFLFLIEILRRYRPRYFLFENVTGLLNMKNKDKSSYFNELLRLIAQQQYFVKCKTLDTANFGLPQQRKRVYILGFREKEEHDRYQWPNEYDYIGWCINDILEENVDEKYQLYRIMKNWKTKDGKSRYLILYSGTRKEKVTREKRIVPLSIIYGDTPSGGPRQQDKVYSKWGISPTITTFAISIPAIIDRDGIWRKLTPRECARLQGFPDDFILPSDDGEAYKQIGNAVTPIVVKRIIEEII